VSVVCCQAEASSTGRSLVPGSPIVCAYINEWVEGVRLKIKKEIVDKIYTVFTGK